MSRNYALFAMKNKNSFHSISLDFFLINVKRNKNILNTQILHITKIENLKKKTIQTRICDRQNCLLILI